MLAKSDSGPNVKKLQFHECFHMHIQPGYTDDLYSHESFERDTHQMTQHQMWSVVLIMYILS